MNKNLIFFFDAPPRAGEGSFRYIFHNWSHGEVICIYYGGLRKERVENGWKIEANLGIKEIYLSEEDNGKIITELIKNNSNAIYILNGFRSKITKVINKKILLNKKLNIVVWSERPGIYGKYIKRLLKRILLKYLNKYIHYKYNNYVDLLLPLGEKGIKTFKEYGWKDEKIRHFLYNNKDFKDKIKPLEKKNSTLKVIYVGRFSRDTKGIDILMKAFNSLEDLDITLDLVGGYGEYKDQVIKWSKNKKNINYLGKWSSDEIVKKISKYDLCVVPSRFDGWNLIVNEALSAGVPVVASNESVSHELIKYGNFGRIFESGNALELSRIIKNIIEAPQILKEWKKNTINYRESISEKEIGIYFEKVLEERFIKNSTEKPKVPWER